MFRRRICTAGDAHERDGANDPRDTDDLAVGGEPGEGHKYGDEYRHWHRQCDDPGHIKEQQLEGGQGRQPLTQHLVHGLQHHVEEQDEEDQRETQSKGKGVFLEHVSGQRRQWRARTEKRVEKDLDL